MNKVVFITDCVFWEEDTGSKQRITRLIDYLSGNGLVVYVYFIGPLMKEDGELLNIRHRNCRVSNIVLDRRGGGRQDPNAIKTLFTLIVNRLSKALFGRVAYEDIRSLADFSSDEVKHGFAKFVLDIEPDYIVVEYIRLAYAIDDIPKNMQSSPETFVDTHDVLSHRYRKFRAAGVKHWLKISEREEARALASFDHVIAIQGQDAKLFRSMGCESVVVVGHPGKLHCPRVEAQSSSPVTLVFVGGENDPNRIAISHFIDSVWPRLLACYGDSVRLKIAGDVCKLLGHFSNTRGVSLLGRVDDLHEMYLTADIVVNPVTIGGGLKIKNVEALCYSLPLVTTTEGAEGLEDGINEAFLVRNTPSDQSTAIRMLIDCPERRSQLAHKAFEFASRSFSPDAVYRGLSELLSKCRTDTR